MQDLQLVAPNIRRAQAELVARGVEVSTIEPMGGDANAVRQAGVAPDSVGRREGPDG